MIFLGDYNVNNSSFDDLVAFKMCKEFGWTYREFRQTPIEVIESFLEIMSLKAKKEQFDIDSQKNSNE